MADCWRGRAGASRPCRNCLCPQVGRACKLLELPVVCSCGAYDPLLQAMGPQETLAQACTLDARSMCASPCGNVSSCCCLNVTCVQGRAAGAPKPVFPSSLTRYRAPPAAHAAPTDSPDPRAAAGSRRPALPPPLVKGMPSTCWGGQWSDRPLIHATASVAVPAAAAAAAAAAGCVVGSWV